jgi:hypothetical protein
MPAMDIRPERVPATGSTGVWPHGAQVRAFGGCRQMPASSSKQTQAPSAAAFSTISGHVSSFHRRTACSSRSTARCTGCCTDQPMRCSSRVAPRGV